MSVLLTGKPHPERGAMSFAFRGDTDMTVTAVGNGLTDTQSQSCTLYEIIQLHEPSKSFSFTNLSNTLACFSLGIPAPVSSQ